MQPPLSRNAPCPCGSGRRYKDCHGAISAAPLPDDAQRRRDEALARALAAQQAGRLADAIRDYEAVLAEVPDHFDALHMLGVACFQRGEFERALSLIDRALALRPLVTAVRFNRDLVITALARRAVETEICQQTLPRLSRFVTPLDAWRTPEGPIDIVMATAGVDAAALALARAACERIGRTPNRVWLDGPSKVVPGMDWPAVDSRRSIDAAAGDHPRDANVIFVGAARSPLGWFERCAPKAVALVVEAFAPCALQDRIRELASDGRRSVALAFADGTLRARACLPGTVLARVSA